MTQQMSRRFASAASGCRHKFPWRELLGFLGHFCPGLSRYLVTCYVNLSTGRLEQSGERLETRHHVFDGLLRSGETKELYADT